MKKSKSKTVKLVQFDGKELRAGTLIIAAGLERNHSNLVKVINRSKEDFEEFGQLERRKVSQKEADILDLKSHIKGRPFEEYLLNEEQTTLLITFLRNLKNNDSVKDFKKRLVKEFFIMKKALVAIGIQRNDPEWQQTRIEGKPDRFSLTDALKPLRLLAIEQNSETTYKDREDTIYLNYTKMIYKALFIFNIPVKKVRGFLNKSQLRDLANIEMIISKLVTVLTIAKLHYKETYIASKEKAEIYGNLIGKTEVIKMDKQIAMFN